MTMKARVNTFALRQNLVESAELGVLGTVAHQLTDEGDYRGTVYRDKTEIATFRISVEPDGKNQQADIDFAALIPHKRRQRGRFEEPTHSVVPKGYLVLYVSEGPGGFSVRLDKLGKTKPQRVFDSRMLRRGDLFVVSLIRPGLYELTDSYGKGKGQITVAYPQAGKKPYVPSPPESSGDRKRLQHFHDRRRGGPGSGVLR